VGWDSIDAHNVLRLLLERWFAGGLVSVASAIFGDGESSAATNALCVGDERRFVDGFLVAETVALAGEKVEANILRLVVERRFVEASVTPPGTVVLGGESVEAASVLRLVVRRFVGGLVLTEASVTLAAATVVLGGESEGTTSVLRLVVRRFVEGKVNVATSIVQGVESVESTIFFCFVVVPKFNCESSCAGVVVSLAG
jgi:hypothetical protein